MPPEGPARKRQRVSQACRRCRSRKYRCDGARPACSSCVSAGGTECLYETGTKRRGLTSGYVKALECLWALVLERIPGSRAGVQDMLTLLSATINDSTPKSRTQREEELSRIWRNSGVPASIEALLAGQPLEAVAGDSLGCAIESHVPWTLPDAYVPTSPAATDDFTFTSTDGYVPTSPQSSARALPALVPSIPVAQEHQITPAVNSSTPANSARTLLPLPDDWLELVQVYLGTEHIWLPVLQRSGLFKAASAYQDCVDGGLQPSTSDKAEFSCLWAVLVLGEIHAHTASSSRLQSFNEMSRYFIDHEDLFADDDLSAHPLQYALVYILWTITYMGQRRLLMARLTLGRALVLATIECSSTSHTPSGAWPSRSIVYSTCFVLDTILAFGMCTKPVLSNSDFHPDLLPLNEDSPDEWEPFMAPVIQSQQGNESAMSNRRAIPNRTCSTFNCLVNTAGTLNDFLHSKEGTSRNGRHTTQVPTLQEIQNLPPFQRQSPAQLHLRLIQFTLYATSTQTRPIASTSVNRHASCDEIGKHTSTLLMHMQTHIGPQLLPASFGALTTSWVSNSSGLLTDSSNTALANLVEVLGKTWLSDTRTHSTSTHPTFAAAIQNETFLSSNAHQDSGNGVTEMGVNLETVQPDSYPDTSTSSHFDRIDPSLEDISGDPQTSNVPDTAAQSTLRGMKDLSNSANNDNVHQDFMHVDPFEDYVALIDNDDK